jgi:hypothetical protein
MLTEQVFRNIEAGMYGVEAITNTSAHASGPYGVFIALEASTVISAIVCEQLTGNTMAGETLPVGVPVRIPHVTSITLTSGACLAYKMPPEAK